MLVVPNADEGWKDGNYDRLYASYVWQDIQGIVAFALNDAQAQVHLNCDVHLHDEVFFIRLVCELTKLEDRLIL